MSASSQRRSWARCAPLLACLCALTAHAQPDLVSIATRPNRFVFNVETTGALNADQVVNFAVNVLRAKLNDLSSALAMLEV